MYTLMKTYIILLLLSIFIISKLTSQNNYNPPYDIYNTTVVASQSGYHLTMGDFNKGIMFGEFILGQSLTPTEWSEAYKEAIVFFEENPTQNLQNIEMLFQTMSQIYSLQDALQIALVRNNLLAELYNIYQSANEITVLNKLINKYVEILNYDPVSKLVLTQQNIDGLYSLYQFTAQASNTRYNPSQAEITQTTKQIIEIFTNGTLDQKQYLCVTGTYNILMRQNYQNMNANNQEQLLNSYLSQYQTNSPQYKNSQYNDANTRDTYQMLSNLSLQGHAASMNSIEAIGGSGDYWYIK